MLICWAETMVPGNINCDAWGEEFKRAVAASGIPTLAGSNYWVAAGPDKPAADPHSFNGAFMFDGQGAEICHYFKRRLVPFGEYIPFTRRFPFLKALRSVTRDQYTPGVAPCPPSRVSEYVISVNICVEDIHPDMAREAVLSGASVLVNLTNDGWFYGTYGPRSHMQAAAWRAIETRRPLLRVTNTGLTVAVDPLGKVELLVPKETASTAVVRPRSIAPATPLPSREGVGGGPRTRTLALLLGDSGEAIIFAAVLICLLFRALGFGPWALGAPGEEAEPKA